MSDDERFTLRTINVNQPQLEHVGSRQSIAADTEEYESAVEPDVSSISAASDDGENPRRYSTPVGLSPADDDDPFLPSSRSNMYHSQADVARGSTYLTVRDDHRNLRRKPIGSSPSPPRVSQIEPAGSPPTPGVDDTPYIHFALDQLTRDEEVRGSRKYGPAVGAAIYPGDAGLDVRDEFGQPISQDGRNTISDDKALPLTPAATGIAPIRPLNPVVPPYQTNNLQNPNIQQADSLPQQEVFIPFEPPVDSLAQPALTFVPGILRPLQLGAYLFLCLLMLAGLAYCAIFPLVHNDGLYNYTVFGGSRYFIFQYLPTLLGMLMLLWLLQIQIALQRIAPFLCMASNWSESRSEGPHLELHPTSFLIPKYFYFRAGQPVIGAAMLVFWLFLWTVPLLAAMFGVVWYGSPEAGTWRWVTVQGVVWTVIALYILLIWVLVVLMLWLPRQHTGLKWDPRSLADLISLISQSNITKDYEGSDVFFSQHDFRERLLKRSDRLGYWHTSSNPNHVFYGIGEEGAAIRRYSLEGGKIREKHTVERSSFPDTPTTYGGKERLDLEHGDVDKIQHRYLPFYLRPSLVLLWIITLFVLYLAFLVVSFVNNAIIHGFAPLTPVRPNASGFGAANFLYSFMPALIAHVLFLLWLSIDYSFRHLQPFSDLNDAERTRYDKSTAKYSLGADAAHSLLLDYPARLPISVTIAAFSASHLRVAWFSILTLTSATLPILAGGAFWAQWYSGEQEVRIAVEPSAYYALCVFLALIMVSLPLALPGLRNRRGLPHASKTLAENLSWLYVTNRSLSAGWTQPTGGRAEMVTRLLEREGTYGFGVVIDGATGRRCIGIYRFVDYDEDESRWDGGPHQTPELVTAPTAGQQQLLQATPAAPAAQGVVTPVQRDALGQPKQSMETPVSRQGLIKHQAPQQSIETPLSQQRYVQSGGLPNGPTAALQLPPSVRRRNELMRPQKEGLMVPQSRNEKTTSSEYGDEGEGIFQTQKEIEIV